MFFPPSLSTFPSSVPEVVWNSGGSFLLVTVTGFTVRSASHPTPSQNRLRDSSFHFHCYASVLASRLFRAGPRTTFWLLSNPNQVLRFDDTAPPRHDLCERRYELHVLIITGLRDGHTPVSEEGFKPYSL